MDVVITTVGEVRMIYDESIDVHSLGTPCIVRGSHVEPTEDGCWTADLSPVGGPVLGPFSIRSLALAAEVDWLTRHWLSPSR
ncbi:hypothetical protein Pla22_41570 [Rubripirellula amarantea]|uniref:Uncharacterized protein n=1 Tax=Rubripirellula amarantea TaxID=2527999 RepID=A0A5C5WMR8_9BACT|nr:hypothetical protein [Rubripirellula amarantea]TWT51379.1 hypothetical protein Pla22_41570 [Rubripirellula amarantea]